jgi:hypothetical protein
MSDEYKKELDGKLQLTSALETEPLKVHQSHSKLTG